MTREYKIAVIGGDGIGPEVTEIALEAINKVSAVISFELDGKDFLALNGGPHYKLSPAVSFVVHCNDQQEVDYYWDKLTEGGEVRQALRVQELLEELALRRWRTERGLAGRHLDAQRSEELAQRLELGGIAAVERGKGLN